MGYALLSFQDKKYKISKYIIVKYNKHFRKKKKKQ